MKNLFFYSIIFIISIDFSFSQILKKIDFDSYPDWKYINYEDISNDGNIISYNVKPQKGNPQLIINNLKLDTIITFERVKKSSISSNSLFLSFSIDNYYDSIRFLKVKKIKKDNFPKDSLGIYFFKNDTLLKFPSLVNFCNVSDKYDILLFTTDTSILTSPKSENINDTLIVDSTIIKTKTNKDKFKTVFLYLIDTCFNLIEYKKVEKYSVSKNGDYICFTTKENDTSNLTGLFVFSLKNYQVDTLFFGKGSIEHLVINNDASYLAWSLSNDTSLVKRCKLNLTDLSNLVNQVIVDSITKNLEEEYTLLDYSKVYFNKIGNKLFFGVNKYISSNNNDSIPDDEKYYVNIWHWNENRIQTFQENNIKLEKEKTYLALYSIEKSTLHQLCSDELPEISINLNGPCKIGLIKNEERYSIQSMWKSNPPKDIYIVDLESNKRRLAFTAIESYVFLSANEKFVYYFADSNWYCENIKSKKNVCISCSIPTSVVDETNDLPIDASSYGFAGWTPKDEFLLIYDKFDIWIIDPNGLKAPKCLTNHFGLTNNIRLRYLKINPDIIDIDLSKSIILKGFNLKTKKEYIYELHTDGSLIERVSGDYKYSDFKISKRNNNIIYKKENFKLYPDIYFNDVSFTKEERISDISNQYNDYLFGNVNLIKWKSYNGDSLEGLLYTPQDLDSNYKYPVIIYFYEKYSDELNRHYLPKPSYSTISFPFYTSNEYIIFVPDISYSIGSPGKSALNAVMSGTDFINNFPFVDSNKIGLQGQSWGGYEVAYIVTQTNRYKAAMAGAPVVNMTSAYSEIRTSTGLCRMFQYEQGQSRIGSSLWENKQAYLDNSPIFFADKVETPLLIMHNTNDGAVPWSEGRSYFLALRRLQKPVWLLSYNNQPHNLNHWNARIDLSIRMKQFFDYYLKDGKEPLWMSEGIPAYKKGKSLGLEFVD